MRSREVAAARRRREQETDELIAAIERTDPCHWSREELTRYLEARGFAVYDDEPKSVLVQAVEEDMDTLPWEDAAALETISARR